ncbi:MAG: DUF4055 domain-containing protein [Dehalococcoidia bacterium]
MHDTHRGERQVKNKGTVYLPATSGQKDDGFTEGQPGKSAYDAYKTRAAFPDVVKMAVDAMVGVMHHKPAVIELPSALERMLEMATLQGESLQMLLRRINEHQLITGRLGLLLDVPDGAPVGTAPYVALYRAESILNWDNGQRGMPVVQNLNLVILDESEFQRKEDFEWEEEKQFRVLILGDPKENEPATAKAVYRVGVFDDATSSFTEDKLIEPTIGGNTLDQIPFVFINAKDIVPDPDAPPLLGLANQALTIYRGEADYRQGLFMQGQDTLVVIGGTMDPDEEIRTGANAAIRVSVGGDAKYIGVESSGLTEMREALMNDKGEASQKGGQLLDSVSRAREAEGTLKIRVAARTASLNQITLAGAFGLETVLKMAAMWVGADPEKVSVIPNQDFADDELSGKTLNEYMTAHALGAPFSKKSIHRLMEEKDLTVLTFEEEVKELEEEEDMFPELGGTTVDGPIEEVDDDDDDDGNETT